MKHKVICFGEMLWDMLPTGKVAGGAPMNVAIHLKQLGIPVTMVSCVGKDPGGDELVSFLKNAGISTEFIQQHAHLPTSEVLVHLDAQGNATFEICEPVAWDDIAFTESLPTEVASSTAIIYGSLASRGEKTKQTLLKLLDSPALKIMDVNLRKPYDSREIVMELMERAGIVKLNDLEMEIIASWYGISGDFESMAQKLFDQLTLETLIITKGENGATLLHKGHLLNHPGFKVQVADTVGAGDSFLAGFLAAHFNGKPIEVALEEASALGAYVASQKGATPTYSHETIEAFFYHQG